MPHTANDTRRPQDRSPDLRYTHPQHTEAHTIPLLAAQRTSSDLPLLHHPHTAHPSVTPDTPRCRIDSRYRDDARYPGRPCDPPSPPFSHPTILRHQGAPPPTIFENRRRAQQKPREEKRVTDPCSAGNHDRLCASAAPGCMGTCSPSLRCTRVNGGYPLSSLLLPSPAVRAGLYVMGPRVVPSTARADSPGRVEGPRSC